IYTLSLHDALPIWVPKGLYMKLVLGRPLNVHIARIPISVLGNALRAPVRPYPELCVAIPIRTLVGLERFPVWLKRPVWNLPAKHLRTAWFRECGPSEG